MTNINLNNEIKKSNLIEFLNKFSITWDEKVY